MNNDALVIGCGYLGLRVARSWLAESRVVYALTRGRSRELAELGVQPIQADVVDPASLDRLPKVRTVLYAVGMDRTAGHSMRDVYVQGLRNVLEKLDPNNRLIYVSSTSVYGQTDGSWVDENSPTEPAEESGRIVLEAESVLRQLRPDAVILRFAGIYGPGRLLRSQALLKGEQMGVDPDKLLNLIHVDDGVLAVLAVDRSATPGSTFTIADDTPVSRGEFYTELGKLINAPPVRFDPTSSPGERHGQTNRRISNATAKKLLGFVPKYASYKDGLKTCVV